MLLFRDFGACSSMRGAQNGLLAVICSDDLGLPDVDALEGLRMLKASLQVLMALVRHGLCPN